MVVETGLVLPRGMGGKRGRLLSLVLEQVVGLGQAGIWGHLKLLGLDCEGLRRRLCIYYFVEYCIHLCTLLIVHLVVQIIVID